MLTVVQPSGGVGSGRSPSSRPFRGLSASMRTAVTASIGETLFVASEHGYPRGSLTPVSSHTGIPSSLTAAVYRLTYLSFRNPVAFIPLHSLPSPQIGRVPPPPRGQRPARRVPVDVT